MMSDLNWLEPFLPLIVAMASMSLVLFVGSLFLIPWLIIRLPRDYFAPQNRQPLRKASEHPRLSFVLTIIKNILGILFIIAGLAMLVLPGQGLITILIGLTFTNFPGKYRLEQWLARKKSILRGMNWIRRRAHRPPLLSPDE